jgi:hypothetical protein
MLQRIKFTVASLGLALGLAGAFTAPALASSGAAGSAKQDVCNGITAAGGSCSENGNNLTGVIRTVINIISVAAGIAAVIMIILGGLRYITSGGDSSKVSGAKSAIIYAIVGLVIVVFSQAIVRFVLGKTT